MLLDVWEKEQTCLRHAVCASTVVSLSCMLYDSYCPSFNDRCQLRKCCVVARPTQSHLLVSTPEVKEGRTSPPSL